MILTFYLQYGIHLFAGENSKMFVEKKPEFVVLERTEIPGLPLMAGAYFTETYFFAH